MSEHQIEKMGLPGERPWGEVLERYPDGSAKLRIINRLFGEMTDEERAAVTGETWGITEPLPRLHSYRQGAEVLCHMDERGLWMPVADECAGRA